MNEPTIPEGRQPALAHAWQLSTVGKDETPCIAVDFEFTDGPAKGEHIIWNGWLTAAAMDFTIKALRTCGWLGDDVEHIEALPKPVILVIEHEEFKGSKTAKVKYVNDPNYQGFGKKMAAEKASSIAQKVKNRLAGVVEDGPAPGADDDIPF